MYIRTSKIFLQITPYICLYKKVDPSREAMLASLEFRARMAWVNIALKKPFLIRVQCREKKRRRQKWELQFSV